MLRTFLVATIAIAASQLHACDEPAELNQRPLQLDAERIPRIAGVTTEYRQNSHADVLITRLFRTDTLDGKGRAPLLKLESVYTDQVPASDTSRGFAAEYGFRISDTVSDALTLGTDKLAVDGVLLIAEHGTYAKSDTGQTQYPKRRLFTEVADVMERSGRVVPVFHDKHLADNWKDAKWIYDRAHELQIPMMAGSSLPSLWRDPPIDVRRGAGLRQIVAVSYGQLDAYGFHALEMVQALAERRAGGETGVASVQCLTGSAVWMAETQGIYDQRLLDAALSRLNEQPLPEEKSVVELVSQPVLFVIDYRDGLRANVFTLNGAVREWASAWQYAESDEIESTLFRTQNQRPYLHFAFLLEGIEKMMHTGKPTWPVERTLLTSGTLDALLTSKRDGGHRLETPWLAVKYQSEWNWQQPPPPPQSR